MKKVIIILFCFGLCLNIQAQTRKQIRQAFVEKKCKQVIFFCRDKKTYDRRINRLLDILDRMGIEYGFKATYKRSEIEYFQFKF